MAEVSLRADLGEASGRGGVAGTAWEDVAGRVRFGKNHPGLLGTCQHIKQEEGTSAQF